MFSSIANLSAKASTVVLHAGFKPIIVGSFGLIGTVLSGSAIILGKKIVASTEEQESTIGITAKKVSGYALITLGCLGGVICAALNGAIYGLAASTVSPLTGIAVGTVATIITLSLIILVCRGNKDTLDSIKNNLKIRFSTLKEKEKVVEEKEKALEEKEKALEDKKDALEDKKDALEDKKDALEGNA